MTSEHILELIRQGEGTTVEFKECASGLNNSVWETVCSFSNRYGGHLLLGVSDDRNVIGVNRATAGQMKRNFINTLNNPNKISPTLSIELEEVDVGDRLVLHAWIPCSSQVELCSDRIFDRSGDADLDITRSGGLVADLYARKSFTYSEREVFPYVTENELRPELVELAQRMAAGEKPDHPWKGMDAMQLMRSAGLYEEDWRTGKKGFNLAGILLFGRDDVIRSCAPGYETDALVRRDNLDRYDDRLIVGTNLIEAFGKLMEFIGKHTMDRFFLVDNQRVSVSSWIAREIVSNILVHREYSKGYPARIVIESDRIYAENWNRSNRHGRIDPDNFTPQPKNPVIASFFVNIGLADKLGSGVRNLYKYTKIYSGGEPELIEGDVFKTIVPLNKIGAIGYTRAVENTESANPVSVRKETRQELLGLIAGNPSVTTKVLADSLGIAQRNVKAHIKALKEQGILVRVGGTRGLWKVNASADHLKTALIVPGYSMPLPQRVQEAPDAGANRRTGAAPYWRPIGSSSHMALAESKQQYTSLAKSALSKIHNPERRGGTGVSLSKKVTRDEVIERIADKPSISVKVLAYSLGITEGNVRSHIKALKEEGALIRVGGAHGHWEVHDEGGTEE